jgi:S-formylglutathione hydrolase FrmB
MKRSHASTLRLALSVGIFSAVIASSPAADASKKSNDPWSTTWVNPPSKPLPTGVSHHTYRSTSMGHDVGYLVYLPPAYAENAAQRFPVIYYLHGGGGNELTPIPEAELLHQQILAGLMPPCVLVSPNGGVGSFYADSVDGKVMGETTVIRELIPLIDATYRTIADRSGRCLQGFSMGALGASKLACKYPDLFCSLAAYAGGMKRLGERFRADQTSPNGGYSKKYLGDDVANWDANDAFALLNKNAAKIKARLAIKLLCGTDDPDHLGATRDFHAELIKLDIRHHYDEVPGIGHVPNAMRKHYEATWFTDHVAAMKAAAK